VTSLCPVEGPHLAVRTQVCSCDYLHHVPAGICSDCCAPRTEISVFAGTDATGISVFAGTDATGISVFAGTDATGISVFAGTDATGISVFSGTDATGISVFSGTDATKISVFSGTDASRLADVEFVSLGEYNHFSCTPAFLCTRSGVTQPCVMICHHGFRDSISPVLVLLKM
jgi:hypothetical protein